MFFGRKKWPILGIVVVRRDLKGFANIRKDSAGIGYVLLILVDLDVFCIFFLFLIELG
jgi:hypothetical protein